MSTLCLLVTDSLLKAFLTWLPIMPATYQSRASFERYPPDNALTLTIVGQSPSTRTLSNCLRVMENVTFLNIQTQLHVSRSASPLITALLRVLTASSSFRMRLRCYSAASSSRCSDP
jgi:hypothetical protein